MALRRAFLQKVSSYTPTYPLDKIVSAWKFDGNALDSVGPNNGTVTEADYISGVGGYQCIRFDNSSEKVVFADNDSLSFGNGTSENEFTFAFLINVDATGTIRLMNKRDASVFEWQIYMTPGKMAIFLQGASGTRIYDFNFTPTISTWYSIIITYNKTTFKSYINSVDIAGTLSGSGYTYAINTTQPLTIGRGSWNADFPFRGKLQNVTIFSDVALAGSQITDLHSDMMDGTFNTLI